MEGVRGGERGCARPVREYSERQEQAAPTTVEEVGDLPRTVQGRIPRDSSPCTLLSVVF